MGCILKKYCGMAGKLGLENIYFTCPYMDKPEQREPENRKVD